MKHMQKNVPGEAGMIARMLENTDLQRTNTHSQNKHSIHAGVDSDRNVRTSSQKCKDFVNKYHHIK